MIRTYESREIVCKQAHVVILVQGKSMLSLLKVCESCIALVINKCDDDG